MTRNHRGGHDHSNPDDLVIGCSACICRVQHDQQAAAIAAAPLRRCTFRCSISGSMPDVRRWHSFAIDLRVPPTWTGDRVADWYCVQVADAFAFALEEQGVDPLDANGIVESDWQECRCSIGEIVTDDSAEVSDTAMPSLFDAVRP